MLKFFGGLWHCCCSVTFASSSCVQTHVPPTQRAPGSMLGGQGTPPNPGHPCSSAGVCWSGHADPGPQMHLGSRGLQLLCTAGWLPVLPTAGLVTPPHSCGPAARPGRTLVLGFYRQRPFSSRCSWRADSERAQQSRAPGGKHPLNSIKPQRGNPDTQLKQHKFNVAWFTAELN